MKHIFKTKLQYNTQKIVSAYFIISYQSIDLRHLTITHNDTF